MDWLPKFVEEHLTFTGKCFRHCGRPTSMKVMSKDSTRVLGAYTCPDGFVSQVVYFSQKLNLNWFSTTISRQVCAKNFTTNDVRVATRHGWELGGNARKSLKAKSRSKPSLTEVYWTRYPRTDAQKEIAISLCTGSASRPGCLKLFSHASGKVEKLCPACRQARKD